MIYSLGERRVRFLGESWYVAPNATVIGDVELHEGASVWFNAVIRGDNDRIIIGPNTNIQDGSVLHTDPGFVLRLGRGVTVGHKVMLHGCDIGDNSLIGINSVVLNGAKVGANCIVGANTLIAERKTFADGCMILGSPGRVVRQLSDEQIAGLREPAQHYVDKIQAYRTDLRPQEG